MDARQEKLKEKEKLSERMETLRQKDVKQLEADRKAVLELTDGKKRERDAIQEQTLNKKNETGAFFPDHYKAGNRSSRTRKRCS